MADSIGLSDVSSPDTGKGSQLKTGGGRRKHNMPSKDKCKNWKKMKYKSKEDCITYGKKKTKSVNNKVKSDSTDYNYEPIPPYGPR